MLHELLLALVGCTGDVFVDTHSEAHKLGRPNSSILDEATLAEPASCPIKLAPDIDFVSESERSVLNRLVWLGYLYRELELFSSHEQGIGTDALGQPDRDGGGSMYQRALATGLAEVLAVYRSAILQLEQDALSETAPVLSTVTQAMHQFEVVLPPLASLVWAVQRGGVKGGALLDLLYAKSHSGVPPLQACMQRLLWHCHCVLYRQLAGWMVHGLLHDPHAEFFVARHDSGRVRRRESVDTTGKAGQGPPRAEDDAMHDWHSGFTIRTPMLPSYISLPMAEAILFVGKAVRVLRHPSVSFTSQAVPPLQAAPPLLLRSSGGTPSRRIASPAPPAAHSPSKLRLPSAGYQGPELLPQAEADKYGARIRELQAAPVFHRPSLEKVVHTVRAGAAHHLWQLLVVHADVRGHLRALKDYFLLAKGDFLQCFLEESRALMRLPPRPTTAEEDLRVPWQQAASKTINEDDVYFQRVSVRLPGLAAATVAAGTAGAGALRRLSGASSVGSPGPGGAAEGGGTGPDGWDALALQYHVEWPLQLLLTPEVLAKYKSVFQYLVRLKRVQLALESAWATAMQRDKADTAALLRPHAALPPGARQAAADRQRGRRTMWRVRQHMSYLITNLQFYIQVDVIEAQYAVLQERIEASKDFEDLARFHQEYLLALMSQSFLDVGSIWRILDGIMALCWQLAGLLDHDDVTGGGLDGIAEEFAKRSNSLYTILRSPKLAGSQRAPFLRQFLLRLNYNSFFEATARGAIGLLRPRTASFTAPQR
ncbi:Gamma-tubulin ring complex protein [Klebsormidium nitens]|uniref:Gamma-tubulin complex component n=1 Tax=Klebsormidium nitens TaxID=105231 RepID=A0A1Y1ISJ5_KLENI|nr:Gamma-tubulin ring complex protein [Klebsormidium nitens]|eukprot:GAQ91736.1 Gamma-tubulin ring complex protein [Klebsormidium nitens]